MSDSTHARVAVAPGTNDDQVRIAAVSIGQELNLPLAASVSDAPSSFDLLLVVQKHRLELRDARHRKLGPIWVDLVAGTSGYRRRTAPSGRHLLARAVCLRKEPLNILDATAGLGRDTFLLACLGCNVVAVERSPVLGALLRDALARAAAHSDSTINAIAARITLIVKDAREFMSEMTSSDAPDVVYLDPMYPPTGKSALAKKEMRICRLLVGNDDDASDLLEVARGVARKRVAVKRQRHAPPLAPDRNAEHLGRTVRYDVYLPHLSR